MFLPGGHEVDNGEVDPEIIAMAKWYCCEIAVKIADLRRSSPRGIWHIEGV